MSFAEARRIMGEKRTYDMDLLNATIGQLTLSKDARVLDIGTGWGMMSISLALNGFNVLTGEPEGDHDGHGGHGHHHGRHHGCGYHLSWEEAAKALKVEDKITYQHFDAEALPFPAESFDGVFMYNTLHHIQDKKRVIQESLRVLNPNGVVCITEMNRYGTEYFRRTYDFEHEAIDPRDFLKRDDISVEAKEGQYANAYILKKI